ncbi:MAG: ABC transporter permease [Candidatus Cloacimonetes bacterium]|nr:ABC transporter permease [Candidatus Cloacimonadota bacterium]
MLKIFLKHEIQNLLKSRRIFLTVIMFLLLFVSIFVVRAIDYQKQINQYLTDVQQSDELMENPTNYSHLNPRAIHRPLVFSIYNRGFTFDRVIDIRFFMAITQSKTLNEEYNPHYSGSNNLDITFLVTFFLSLFILLISYDSVNGEKQSGTLRLLMTFPIKRQSFILKKILGVFIFVMITFTIPYILSVFALMFIYTNLLTASFYLSVFFYWFLVMFFVFFFSLVGILISLCSTNPNRSLVYSILVWLLFSIILPISWSNVISAKLFDKDIATLQQNNALKRDYLQKILDEYGSTVSENTYVMNWGGYFNNLGIIEFEESTPTLYNRLKFLTEEYTPVLHEVEQTIDEIRRKYNSIESLRNWIFFFNPVVLFSDISNKIAGNTRSDYMKFISDARDIQSDLVSLGIREGWLLDYRYYTTINEQDLVGSIYAVLEQVETIGWDAAADELQSRVETATPFTFDMPHIKVYQQPNPLFEEIFMKIFSVLAMFVVSILLLWVATWRLFMRYDVR